MTTTTNQQTYTANEAQPLRPLTSLHALQRIMQRLDLNQQQAMRLIRKAWSKGVTAQQLPRRSQRDYVQRHVRMEHNGLCQLRVYQDYLFIFSAETILITAYALPKSLGKSQSYDRNKEPVRNRRKYDRMNPITFPA